LVQKNLDSFSRNTVIHTQQLYHRLNIVALYRQMREKDLLHLLHELECKKTTREEIIGFLLDEGILTNSGSDFESEIIAEALDELNWEYICRIQRESIYGEETEDEEEMKMETDDEESMDEE